jgi:hypothetical protein
MLHDGVLLSMFRAAYKNRAMIEISGKYIDPNVLSARFRCDLAACRGACCTFPGGSGPPVTAAELGILQEAWDTLAHEVLPEHRAIVRRDGLVERDRHGVWSIRCFDQRACVFVAYERGIAVCAIERAHRRGDFPWPKPLSCHLFPIRVRGDVLHYEEFSECAPAVAAGEREGVSLVSFLAQPLQRAFGEDAAGRIVEMAREWAHEMDAGVQGREDACSG